MSAKFGANRSSRLLAFPDFCFFCPQKNPEMLPWCIEGLINFWPVSIPRRIRTCVATLVPFGPSLMISLVDFTIFLMCDPLNPPNFLPGAQGTTLFSLCPFPDKLAHVSQI